MATVAVNEEIEPLIPMLWREELNAEKIAQMRGVPLFEPPEISDAVERTDHVVDEANGVVVRVHREVGSEGALPCVYSIHGGGYVMGSYEMDDPTFDLWCPKYGIVGVSVEYRLAPETPYPGPLEDCYAGLKWTYDHAEELGVDRDKIGIMGASAGGGLCAALALLARDRGQVPLQFQLLDSPMLDDRQITPSSQIENLVIWNRESNAFGWQCYLGDLYGSDDVPYTAAPARAEDLSDLPEAYVCVGGADGFRDEDITYAMRLYGAGVPTELHVYPGAPHGVQVFTQLEIAQSYIADQEDWLRRQIERLG